jgi:arginase
VLAGDCNNAIGVVSGLSGDGGTGLVWLDAHGDANTPATTESGFFDGMPLAVVLGSCWSTLAGSVPGFVPLPGQAVVHLGGRAFDLTERAAMTACGVSLIDADAMRSGNGRGLTDAALNRLARETSKIHVHLDLDVIDRADGIVSEHAVGGGPSIEDLEAALRTLGDVGHVASMTICSYDPAFDADGRAAAVGVRLLRVMAPALGG